MIISVTCGSTNIDFRSFENNFECNIFFYDKDLALRIKEIYLNDEKDCVDIEEIRDYTPQIIRYTTLGEYCQAA